MTDSLDIPDAVRLTALGHGALGTAWLHDLPAIVDDVVRRWNLVVGRAFTGGTAGFVAAATTPEGTNVVLKIAMPDSIDGAGAFERTVSTFELTAGRGCARLLAHDNEHSALLLERLGRNLDELGLPVRRQLEIICATVRRVWVRVPDDTPLRSGAAKAEWLAEYIPPAWEECGRPCAAKTVDLALRFAAERAAAFDPASAVLVHGDAHSWNTLEAGVGEFKLVDPEGLVSEPAHDLGIPMRELNQELLHGDALQLGRERARALGELTGVDANAIWQWGFVERVSTGLYSMQGAHDGAQEFLDIADRWAEA